MAKNKHKHNIVVNSDAATGDTSGWDTATNVTVLHDDTDSVELNVRIGHEEDELWGTWLDDYSVKLAYEGPEEDNCFTLGQNVLLEQHNLTGFSSRFSDGKLTCKFKFGTAQDLWDARVLGRAVAEITYSDENIDKFIIPCVVGVKYSGRDKANNWKEEVAVCLKTVQSSE